MYPTFDGNILKWKCFLEQFCISVSDHSFLSDSEKLIYLQHALKDDSAKHVIEGLSRSGKHYTEAVKRLTSCYDHLHLIHQTCQGDPWGTFTQGGYRKGAVSIAWYRTAAPSHSESNGLQTMWSLYHLDTWTQARSQHHDWVAKTQPEHHCCTSLPRPARVYQAQASETSVADSSKKLTKHESVSARISFASSKPVALFVTRWVKTRHIAHFMKIEIRPEISIPMCNCAAGKKWKRSAAWFPSYRAKCVGGALSSQHLVPMM